MAYKKPRESFSHKALEKPWIVFSGTARIKEFKTALEASKFVQNNPGTKFNKVGK